MIGWDGYFPSMLRPWISLANEAALLQISKDMALSRQISQFKYCGHVNEKNFDIPLEFYLILRHIQIAFESENEKIAYIDSHKTSGINTIKLI